MTTDFFRSAHTAAQKKICEHWRDFLIKNHFRSEGLSHIDFSTDLPTVIDSENRKFQIDFINDKANYKKKKAGLKTEFLSRAVGSGRYGKLVFDLSAGLGIDAVFLSQLGYEVRAVERNPLIYLCLQQAVLQTPELNLKFIFADSFDYIKSHSNWHHAVLYFDPMFPQKGKSALPRQEMVIFKNMVGPDEDAAEVVRHILQMKKTPRLVVKRPLQAPPLVEKANGAIEGKLIRYDIYSASS